MGLGGADTVESSAVIEASGRPPSSVSVAAGERGHFARWFIRRLLLGVATLFALSVVVFVATQALPSDPARAILGGRATPGAIAALRRQLGLDQPVLSQYLSWLGGIVHGDFGTSIASRDSVAALIGNRVFNSLVLLFFSGIVVLPMSFLLGTMAAARRGKLDSGLWLVSVVLSAVPDFVMALTLVIVFAITVIHLFPAVALIPPGESALNHLDTLVLPIATLVLLNVPYLYRLVRASMIDVLGSEYVAMARLKGMPPRIVIRRHALRNALLPAIQGSGLVLGWLFSGVVVVETVFQYPGLGSALTTAVQQHDLPVVQGISLIFAVAIVLFNLIADALTVYLTPKLRTSGDL